MGNRLSHFIGRHNPKTKGPLTDGQFAELVGIIAGLVGKNRVYFKLFKSKSKDKDRWESSDILPPEEALCQLFDLVGARFWAIVEMNYFENGLSASSNGISYDLVYIAVARP